MFIKDQLFYHDDEPVDPAPEIGEAHLRGWWMTASEWRASHGNAGNAARTDRAWVVQPRMAWLASRRLQAADANALIAESNAIHARLNDTAVPTMIAAYARNDEGAWFEDTRGFIVPDDWPERAQAFAAVTTI